MTSAVALRIECDYASYESVVSECITRNLNVTSPDDKVISISGVLMEILVYEKINSFKIESSPNLEYFPKGIEKFFPNIKTLTISQTGLKVLTSDDLKIFPKLKNLIISENKLEELNASLFEFNREIKNVDLSGNNLKHLGVNFLKFAENLNSIDLSSNICVNGSAESPVDFKRLKIKIDESCPPSHATINEAKFSVTFLLLILAVIISVLIIFNCIKFIVE